MNKATLTMATQPFVALGEDIIIDVTLRAADGKPGAGEVAVAWHAARQKVHGAVNVRLDAQGKGRATVPPDAELREGTLLFAATAPGAETARATVGVYPPAAAKELADLSARLALPAGRIAFAGDSLTAMHPDANYVAIIANAIRAQEGDAATVINAGVGGDTIERVERRLDRDVIAAKPDWVFIFVGHNDSKIAWLPDKNDFGECFCPIDRFEASYRHVIAALQKAGVKRISIMSASASYAPTCLAVHEAGVKAHKKHNYFGRPDQLEAYNTVMKQLADEYKLDYVDLYTPMKASPEWSKMCDHSGVHVTETGDRFIAAQVLKFLVEKGQAR